MVETKEKSVEKTNSKVVTLSPEEAALIREKLTLSPEEAAFLLGYGLTTTYALLRDGTIPSFKNGRFWRIRRAAVDEYIERREVEDRRG